MPSTTYVHGRFVADPELKFTPSQKKVCNFKVASDEAHGNGKITTFFECDAWETLAQIVCDYCYKGKEVIVIGWMEEKRWKDGATGLSRNRYVLHASTVEFCGTKADSPDRSDNPVPDVRTEEQKAAAAAARPNADPASGFVKVPDEEDPFSAYAGQ